MNRIVAAVVAFALWSAGMFASGWAWRGDRAEGEEAKRHIAVAEAESAKVQQVRQVEHQQAEAMAEIGAKHEEDRQAAAAVPDAVVAELRAGTLRLRNDLATCNTARLSEAAASASQRDEGAQLRAEIAGSVVRIGRDADDQLRACQAVVRAYERGAPG
ncbi:lysis system i-spanin subunit Rz [[Pseudomonas] boreopolis]|uniref:Lysozyme n=1 Tax=Xanthomonas boreopolis TaxID=86183 RepID=A0A919F8Y9_9XANT|nr:hypothetical protein GCM10009090_25310 [[Pseudomonas] boreopolis]